MINSPLPLTLAAARGTLRRHSDIDWPLERALSFDPEVVRWTTLAPHLSDAAAQARVVRSVAAADEGRTTRYVIESDGVAVGQIGIGRLDATPEIFYALLLEARGIGLASAAAEAVSAWALQHGAASVTLLTIPGNAPSEAVAARAGFVRSGTEDREQRGTIITMNRWVRTRA